MSVRPAAACSPVADIIGTKATDRVSDKRWQVDLWCQHCLWGCCDICDEDGCTCTHD